MSRFDSRFHQRYRGRFVGPLGGGGPDHELADYYVDAVTGSNSNNGSYGLPFLTLAKALTVATSGQTIALTESQYHPTTGFSTAISGVNVVSRSTTLATTLDARQDLSAKVWTLESGTTWKTSVTFRSTTTAGGVGSNTTSAGVWFNEVFYAWQVGGADIAANVANVGLTAGSFAINKTGSTTQDIRSQASSTGPFDLYIHMADGSDPNGKAVKIADQSAVCLFQGGHPKRLIFKGAWGKDSLGIVSYSGAIPTFEDCQSVGFGEHAWVGPINSVGTWTSIGEPRPGMTGYSFGRSAGAAYEMFTNVYRSTDDLTAGTLNLSKAAKGVYIHGSGNKGYRSFHADHLIVDNCTAGVQDDGQTTTLVSMFDNGMSFDLVTMTNVDTAFSVTGILSVDAGTITFGTAVVTGTSQSLCNATGAAPVIVLKDVNFTFGLTYVANTTRYYLCGRSTSASFSDPDITLDNCHDLSSVNLKGKLQRGGTGNIQSKIILRLTNGTTIGDIMDQATGVNYPAGLYVGSGCTFGMGDRTGPQIEAALTAAGVPYLIDHNTTVVNRAGAVLSAPGW